MLMKINVMQTLDFENVTNASHAQEGDLRGPLKQVYGLPEDNKSDLFDMATGESFRPGCVIAAHIFQYRWQRFLPTLSTFTDINDLYNGLFLYKPVKWAFDRAKLCIQTTKTGAMTFHLLDQGLCDVKLTDKAATLRKVAKHERPFVGREITLQTTFGDLNGQDVQFPPGSKMRPSRQLLALHAYAAWLTFTSLNPNSQVTPPGYSVSEDESTGDALNYIIEEWTKKLNTL
jgi:hypothetical protein